MPIFGADGGLVGIVDRVSGVRIVVRRTGASDADQHVIAIARVASVTDRVTLDCPAADARPQSATATGGIGDRRRAIGPITWGAIGVAALLLIYGAGTLILRGKPEAAPSPAPTLAPVAKMTPKPALAPPAARAPSSPAGTPLARAASVAEFLNSNDPVPRRFSLDSVAFAPGSATLDGAAAKTIDGIAGVMTTHLNTKIKLGASTEDGALALRRAAAIRAALILRGVAGYRIALGPSRVRSRDSKTGIEMVILAK